MRATSRAALVSPEIGRIARRATQKPTRNAKTVPMTTPSSRKKRTRPIVALRFPVGLPYWIAATAPSNGRGVESNVPVVVSERTNSGREMTR